MKRRVFLLTVALLSAGSALLSGCTILEPRPDRSRFFLLTPLAQPQAQSFPGDVVIIVGPVKLPDYLDRLQIVSRSGENRLLFSDLERWGEPLEVSFVRALTLNLTILLGTEQIFPYPPYVDVEGNYQIALGVVRFERSDGRTVVLEARWGVQDLATDRFVHTASTVIREPAASGDAESIVTAMSAAVRKLSEEMAPQLLRLAAR